MPTLRRYQGDAVHPFVRVKDIALLLCHRGATADGTYGLPLHPTAWRIPEPSYPATSEIFKHAITPYGRAYAFGMDLASLPGYSEFTAMFEQYRIKKIVFTLVPKYTEVLVNPQVTGNGGEGQANEITPGGSSVLTASVIAEKAACPQIYISTDTDDLSLSAFTGADAVTNMMQRSHRMYRGNRQITWTVSNPSVNSPLYNTATTVGYQGKVSPWIQTSANGTSTTGDAIPHFGVKILIDGAPGNGIWSYRLFAKVHVECKTMK